MSRPKSQKHRAKYKLRTVKTLKAMGYDPDKYTKPEKKPMPKRYT